jgi:transposase
MTDPTLNLDLSAHQRRVLEQIADSLETDAVICIRAQFILDWADGLTGNECAELRGTSRRTVSKWRNRFRIGGIAALADRPRPGAPRVIPRDMADELERLRQSPPPPGSSRWTTRLLAKHTGMSQSTVVRLDRERREAPALDLIALVTQEHSQAVGSIATIPLGTR